MKQLQEKIYITKGTVNSLTDLEENSPMNNLITYLETEFPDSSWFFDVSLEALFETLEYNGLNETEVIRRTKTRYGAFIDFTYYTDLQLYVMEYGVN